MKVVELPSALDHTVLDPLFASLEGAGMGEGVLLDAFRTRFVDPAGMVALLALGHRLGALADRAPRLRLPESTEVQGYMARMGFFPPAAEVFQLDGPVPRPRGGASDVLLEITPIVSNRDVHAIVDRVQDRAGMILSRSLRFPLTGVIQFSVVLSEVCQNIVEHAEGPGWVSAQVYQWTRRLGRHVLVLAVSDVGRGFRGSLASQHASRFADRWSDAAALEAAFLHGVTRFPDPGRGQGLQQIRRNVRRWEGSISVRSGTARIADVPEWDRALPPLEEGLPPFPGTQITILLPERPEEIPGTSRSGGGGR